MSHRALLLCGWLFISSVTTFASGGTKAAPAPSATPRPVARLISGPRVERRTAGEQPRARLVTATRVATIGAQPAYTITTAAAPSPSVALAIATSEERRAFDLINEQRRSRGERPLVWDSELCRLARLHAQDMARHNFLSHTGRTGLDAEGRAAAVGIRGWRALGENIAYNQGYDDPAEFAVERWMVSHKHRENIMNGEFTHSGLGVAKTADGRVYFTQVFMSR